MFGFAGLGIIITIAIVAYFVLTNSYPPQEDPTSLLVAFAVLCPPSFLSVPFIDAETGTEHGELLTKSEILQQ